MKIYNLGSLNIDYVYQVPHFVAPGETLSSSDMKVFPGGKGLNQSVALARAGANVIHGGRIGENGFFLREILKEAGADVRFVEADTTATGHAVIQVEKGGQNCILLYPGANHSFKESFIRKVLYDAEPGDILLLQNEINSLACIFDIAREKGLSIAFNPSPFRTSLLQLPLHRVKWWLCNEIEGSQITGEMDPEAILEAMYQKFPDSTVVLTLGADGSLCREGKQVIRQQAFRTTAVDTTAAGDTFTGYFLASVVQGDPVEIALEYASRAASIAVSRMGASASIPWRRELC